MKMLYCPKCSEYLEGGDGSLQDCHCGWSQPEETPLFDQYISEYDEEEIEEW